MSKKRNLQIEGTTTSSNGRVHEEEDSIFDKPVHGYGGGESKKKKSVEAPRYIQWITHGSDVYYPEFPVEVVDSIPTGYYNIGFDSNVGKYFVRKQTYKTDNILELPMPETKEIVKDITTFWKKKKDFDRYGLTYKRGMLMFGPAGCGKSHIIQLIIKNLIEEQGGVVFRIETAEDVSNYSNFMHSTFKVIEKTRRVVTIIEDIDGLFHSGKATETILLNILDGMNHMDNIVYLATTNYPEELAERIMNRPSRFDRRYKIGLPNDEVRKFYLENTLLPADLKKIDIDEWVKKTEKLSIAHLRELIVSVVIQGNTFESMVALMQEYNDPSSAPHSKRFGGSPKIGFSTTN